MKSLFISLIVPFEFIAFLVSLSLYLKKPIPAYLKFFPFFLLITVIVETIGHLFASTHARPVLMMYNYFSVFEFLFYFFVVYHLINSARVRRIILVSAILYPIIAIIYILHRVGKLHAATYSLGAVLLVCFCLYYIYEFFKVSVSKDSEYSSPFWICLGLLLYYSCTLPIWAFWGMGHKNQFEIITSTLIICISNYLLYSLFAIAFLCRIKMQKPKLVQ